VEQVLHPTRQALLLVEESTGDFRAAGEDAESEPRLLSGSSLPIALGRVRDAVSLERLEEDPRLRDLREGGTAQMTALGADLVVPVVIRDRVTGCLVLGGKRAGTAYSSEDLRLLRLLVNQSALALEHAKSYTALERANAELKVALQRVEILESIRSNLAKFVPRTVQDLIERAPEAPALDKRETDVTVLFVDIAGYTRLSERVDPARVNELVERYFGAFLDEILRRGGDVNETAGDGLMAIFQDPDPGRHARAAVKTALAIVRRTEAINRDGAGAEPIQVHVGVNSGVATVGATKIEGRTGIRWTYTASGPVTNVAARLAALDAADGIVVGPETRRRLGDEFAFEALGEQRLRNVAHPVAVFRLAAPAPSPTPAPAPVGP
jgi:class 3 adenylate cyclase